MLQAICLITTLYCRGLREAAVVQEGLPVDLWSGETWWAAHTDTGGAESVWKETIIYSRNQVVETLAEHKRNPSNDIGGVLWGFYA